MTIRMHLAWQVENILNPILSVLDQLHTLCDKDAAIGRLSRRLWIRVRVRVRVRIRIRVWVKVRIRVRVRVRVRWNGVDGLGSSRCNASRLVFMSAAYIGISRKIRS